MLLNIESRGNQLVLVVQSSPESEGQVVAVFIDEAASKLYTAALKKTLLFAREVGRAGI